MEIFYSLWRSADFVRARNEGWYISVNGFTIHAWMATNAQEWMAETKKNPNMDADMKALVQRRADEGSEFHRRALRTIMVMQLCGDGPQ